MYDTRSSPLVQLELRTAATLPAAAAAAVAAVASLAAEGSG